MPKKKQPESKKHDDPNVMGLRAEVLEQPICQTLESNYMPYAMSVIVSRAIPEIDGFKPSHRKLLYTMYKMGLLTGSRTKSANIVGQTMRLNPHGDAAIYDTMVRMGRGNESLLVPFVDSKGNFGKAYSRDMSCAAARYTEAKLESVCEELFRDIDKETVDFVPNYDGTTTEPTLLPVTFPTILANNTLGIAVGMACNICSFNLAELCNTTIALMKDAKHDISTTMPAAPPRRTASRPSRITLCSPSGTGTRSCASCRAPAARTRSASTSPRSAIRCSATCSTAAMRPCSRAPRCMRPRPTSRSPSPGSPCTSPRRSRRTCARLVLRGTYEETFHHDPV